MIHHALIKSDGRRDLNVMLHLAIPIKEDVGEHWLDSYPEELKITTEVAAEALQEGQRLDFIADQLRQAHAITTPALSSSERDCYVDRERFMSEVVLNNIGFAKKQSQLDKIFTVIPSNSSLRQHLTMADATVFCEGYFSSPENYNSYAYIIATFVTQPNAYLVKPGKVFYIENVADLVLQTLFKDAVVEYGEIRDKEYISNTKAQADKDSFTMLAIWMGIAAILLLAMF